MTAHHYIVYDRESGEILLQSSQNAELSSVRDIWPRQEYVEHIGKRFEVERCGLWELPLGEIASSRGVDFIKPLLAALHAAHRALRIIEGADEKVRLVYGDGAWQKQIEQRAAQATRKARTLELGERISSMRSAIAAGACAADYAEDIEQCEAEIAALRKT